MARIVLGVGTSHSPILTLESSEWRHRAEADLQNPSLSLMDGRRLTYAELAAERGEPYAEAATEPVFEEIAVRCRVHLDRIADEIAASAPDVVIIVGDDQSELYSPGNMPAIALFWGEQIVTHAYDSDLPPWMQTVAKGYGMDRPHRFPGHPALALDLIQGLVDRNVDLAICRDVPDPHKAGFGHAFGFPVERLFRGREIPVIPVMLNTYYPPNVLSASRCLDVGRALREAIEASTRDLRVAILASGGLSHFVVEEALDRQLFDNLHGDRVEALRAIRREALLEGSSEILNWVLAAGAVSHLPLKWKQYEAVRRTPAGTGIGLGFAVWGDAA